MVVLCPPRADGSTVERVARRPVTDTGMVPGRVDGAMFDRLFGRRRVVLLVDGPNLLRDEFDLRLEDLRAGAEDAGRLVGATVYLDHHAPESLIEAVETNGMTPVVTSGDVDVRMAVEAVEHARDGRDLVLATRDADFVPAIDAAHRADAHVTVLGADSGMSAGLESAADEVVLLS